MFWSGYRICLISSLSWHLHKSYFPLQSTQKDVFVIEYCICKLKVRVDCCTNRIFRCKTLKQTCFWWIIAFVQFNVRVGTCTKLIFQSKTINRRLLLWNTCICAILNQSRQFHKSDFLQQNTQNDVFCFGILHLCNLKSELTVA